MPKNTVYWAVLATTAIWPQKRILQQAPRLLLHDKNNFSTSYYEGEEDHYEATISRCPAHQKSKNNIFYIPSPLDIRYELDNFGTITSDQKYSNYVNHIRKAQYDNRFTVQLDFQYIFFSKENISIEVFPPYLHKTELQNYGVIATGEFNISKWFRSINMEFILWENSKIFSCKENEPLCYIKFYSDNKIHLQEFKCNDNIFSYSLACSRHPQLYKNKQSLENRYKKFDESLLSKSILQEIKQNIVN